MFEPFFSTKGAGKGTGLGLAMCRHVMQEHAGTIRIESQLGAGAQVVIEIPVERSGTMVDERKT